MRRFLSLLLVCAAALLLLAGTAYAANTTDLRIAQIRQNGGDLYLYLTGANDFGEAALDTASLGDYSVSMSGTELQLSAAEDSGKLNESIHYIVCVDVSASIVGDEKQYVRDAVAAMIDGLRANEWMTVFTFGDKVTPIAEKTNDKAALHAAVSGLSFPDQTTAMYEVIDKSTKYAADNRSVFDRSAVLIITDGTDEASGGSKKYTYDTILNNVMKRNVPVYTATFFRKDTSKIQQSLDELENLSLVSGGRVTSLSDAGEGYRMTDVLTNLEAMTRQSTRLTAQINSGLNDGHSDKDFKAVMSTNGGDISTPEHAFTISWNNVPEPPDTTLEKLEVYDINEDSTVIEGSTEPGSTVTIKLNGKRWNELVVGEDGQISWDFENQLGPNFQLHKGDKIIVSAVDGSENKNSLLPDGNEGVVNKVVGESSRADITVKIKDAKDGVVYGDKITVYGDAEPSTQVFVVWEPLDGEQKIYGPIKTSGKSFNCTLNASDCTLGEGKAVVYYADYKAYGRQNNSDLVSWIQDKPVEDVLKVLSSSISEDSQSIKIQTEPNAEVKLLINGAYVDLGENNTANDKGIWEYPLLNNSEVSLKKNRKLKIEVTDASGRTVESDEITIEESSRRNIDAHVKGKGDDEDVYYGEVLNVPVIGEGEVPIKVSMWDASTKKRMGDEQEVANGGSFTVAFNAADCGVVGDEGTECYIQAEYADNLGRSKSYTSPQFTWIGHEPVVKEEIMLEVDRLREDSKQIKITTNRGADVTVQNLTQGTSITPVAIKAPENGVVSIDLGTGKAAVLNQGDEIEITVQDGEDKKTQRVEVEAPNRAQITVKVLGLDANAYINQESITVQGNAERGQKLLVRWYSTDPSGEGEVMQETTVDSYGGGFYEVPLSAEEFNGGKGRIEVSYADGLAASKTGYLEEGQIEWNQVTPTPTATLYSPPPENTPTPSPVPTSTPTPPPTPTPSPEPSFVQNLWNNFTNIFGGPDNMMKDWRFWAVVAAVVLLLAAIVVLIVYLIRKYKKANEVGSFTPDDDIVREGEYAEAGTQRQNAPDAAGTTARTGASTGFAGSSSGTVSMNGGDSDYNPSGTISMTQESTGFDSGDAGFIGGTGEGTVRLSAVDMMDNSGGTVRITSNMGPQPMMVKIRETRDWAGVANDTSLSILEEATVGRNSDNDLTIHDETVSGHHLKLIRRGDELFALDLMSSNGTMRNGQRISTETKLESGDKLIIGRTTLTIEF